MNRAVVEASVAAAPRGVLLERASAAELGSVLAALMTWLIAGDETAHQDLVEFLADAGVGEQGRELPHLIERVAGWELLIEAGVALAGEAA